MKLLLVLIICLPLMATAQFNFDFENVNAHGNPEVWDMTALSLGTKGYKATIDTVIKYSGKNSVKITLNDELENATFGAIDYVIPAVYEGNSITLKGYLKIENVTGKDAFAAIWMRIDGSNKMLEFDNMEDDNLSGTFDWQQFTITLPLSPKAKMIHVGALMIGEGSIWVDAFEVTIDGKLLTEVKEKPKPLAEMDTEFDKGSKVEIGELTSQKLENLEILGLIWGFLKYHHPNIAKGNFNMDYELFRVMPSILEAKNAKKRSAILLKWINGFGDVPNIKLVEGKHKNAKLLPDLDWMKNEKWFSPKLIEQLEYIRKNRNQEDNYYISMAQNIGNPIFENENPYTEMVYPDDGFRMLALYRYWNIIQYFFPYKYLIEEDWKTVLTEFVPRFAAAKNETEYTLLTVELIARVHDSHAAIWGRNQVLDNHFGMKYAIPEIRFIENKAVIVGFYNDSVGNEMNLSVGDVITKVDGKTVEEIVKEKLPYATASNYPTQLRNIAVDLLRGNETTMKVEIDRNGNTFTKDLELYNVKISKIFRAFDGDPKYKNYEILADNIGYINLGHINGTDISKMMDSLKNTKGIIIDIRNYPSEFVVFVLGNKLVPKSTPFAKFTSGDVNEPGLFTMGDLFSVGEDNPDYYKGKVVILINEISQSQAEYTTMAFRTAPNATVIGSTTAAADGNVSGFSLPGGIRTGISGIGVYYPDGTETQRIGIVPDIEFHPTIEGVRNGKDEVLEKAIEVILD